MKTFALATAHRAENVDDIAVLESFMEVFSKSPLPIVYPMHPRTKKRLQENNMLIKMEKLKNLLDFSTVRILGFLDFDEKLQIDTSLIQAEFRKKPLRQA